MNLSGRFIPKDTVLICPCCRKHQAIISVDIWPDQTWDWRAVNTFKKDAIIGVSYCCNVRYITFEGLFYTEKGVI